MRWALRARRLERKWSQIEVAQRLGVSRSFYGMIEIGHRNPTLQLALKMADLMGVDIRILFF